MTLSASVSLCASIVGGHAAPYTAVVGLHPLPGATTVTGVAPDLRIASTVAVAIPGLDAPTWVDGPALAAALKAMGPAATLAVVKGRLTISVGKAKRSLATHATGYGYGDPVKGEPYEIDAASVVAAIGRVQPAAGVDPARPQIFGVLFAGDRVAATDGHRLHVSPATVPRMDVVLPSPFLAAIARAVETGSVEAATVTVGASDVSFEAGTEGGARVAVRSQICSAPFPPFAQMVAMRPRSPRSARIMPKALLEAIKVARLAGRDDATTKTEAPIVLTAKGGDLIVASAVDGASEAACPCEGEIGPVSTSAAYLVDAVSTMGGEEVEVVSGTAEDPVMFIRGDDVRIVMPRRP